MEPDSEGLRLPGPDREIPLAARVHFLFGGFANQFGWTFVGFSGIHFRVFTLHALMGRLPGIGYNPAILIPVVFQAIGWTFLVMGLRKGLRGIRLLRHGVTGTGRLASKTGTNTYVNNQRVYELAFEFTTAWGTKARAVTRTPLTDRLEDESVEPLVYDPRDPAGAVMLDDLPGCPRLDDEGVRLTRDEGWLHFLIVPGLSVLVHGLWLLLAGI